MVIDTYRGSRAPKATHVPATLVVNECQQMAGGNMSEAAKRQRDGDLLEWEHDVESIVSYLGRVQNLPFPLPSTVEIPM